MLLFSLITHHQADVKREADLRGKISKETSQVASTAQEHEHWRHKVHARTHARTANNAACARGKGGEGVELALRESLAHALEGCCAGGGGGEGGALRH